MHPGKVRSRLDTGHHHIIKISIDIIILKIKKNDNEYFFYISHIAFFLTGRKSRTTIPSADVAIEQSDGTKLY